MEWPKETDPLILLRQQTALAKFGELALKSDSLDEILTEACRLVGDTLGTDLAKVVELQDDGRTLLVRAGVGWKPGVVGVATVQAAENTSEGHALKTAQPMISPDIATETRFTYSQFLIDNGVRAVANVVILGGYGRPPYGILQIDSRTPRRFTVDDTAFLRSYANLIAAAVDRLRVIDEIRETEARLQLALEAGALGSWDLDLDKGTTYRTPQFDRIFGYDGEPSVWTHANFVQHVLPEDRQRVTDAFRHAAETGTELHVQCRIRRGTDLAIRWIEVQSRFVGGWGKTRGRHLIGVVTDISERILTEERIQQSQRIEAIGRLTGGIAHDFNNLLQTLLGGLELALDEVQDRPTVSANLRMTLQAGQRGSRLTSHLLSFSRQQMLHPVALELFVLVGELAGTLERTLGPHIAIRIEVPSALPPVLADAAHLDSALLNLALNARDAMPQGGQIWIKAAPVDGQVVISVTDTGEGMAPDVLMHACEPFFTTKGVNGSGLGLSMVQGFARQSGGELRLHSVVGQGTRVEICLPTAPYPVAQRAPAASHARGEGDVLLVDDDQTVRRVIGAYLTKAGFVVTAVDSGIQALAELETSEFDVMVTDYAMPVMNGAVLAERARAVQANLPILILTGYPGAGALGHLPADVTIVRKPCGREDLISQVLRVLQCPAVIGVKAPQSDRVQRVR